MLYHKPSLQPELQVTNSLWYEGRIIYRKFYINFQNFTRTLLVFKSDQRLKWRRVVVLLSEVKKNPCDFVAERSLYKLISRLTWNYSKLKFKYDWFTGKEPWEDFQIIRFCIRLTSWPRRSDNLHKPIRLVQRRAELILVLNDNELSLNHEKSKIHTSPPFCLCSFSCCFKQRVARVLGLVHNDFLREAVIDAFILKKHVWN